MTTFDRAVDLARNEFDSLRDGVEDKAAFDKSVAWMRACRFSANLETGTTRNQNGVVANFLAYDWANSYTQHPERIFFDFFRGALMNKYTRLVRGIDHA